jgi:hypothetical protein
MASDGPPRAAAEPTGDGRLCPSTTAAPGTALIGIVGGNGRVGILGRPLPVDDAFLDAARAGRAPEKRFRFAGPCMRADCRQWSGGRCGVIDRVLAITGETERPLPPCGIRARCRWFAQRGGAACHACPEVVTDTRDAVPAS